MISATHRNLTAEVERKTFRQDLFYRLNVITIPIPAALRERKEDILPLIRYFLSRMDGNYSLTYDVQDAMLGYGWPGNVRELSNCLQRMTALNSGPLLHTTDLPSPLRNYPGLAKAEQGIMTATVHVGPAPGSDRAAASRSRTAASGNLAIERNRTASHSGGARIYQGRSLYGRPSAGIGRTTLYRKMKEYCLEALAGLGRKPVASSEFSYPQRLAQ